MSLPSVSFSISYLGTTKYLEEGHVRCINVALDKINREIVVHVGKSEKSKVQSLRFFSRLPRGDTFESEMKANVSARTDDTILVSPAVAKTMKLSASIFRPGEDPHDVLISIRFPIFKIGERYQIQVANDGTKLSAAIVQEPEEAAVSEPIVGMSLLRQRMLSTQKEAEELEQDLPTLQNRLDSANSKVEKAIQDLALAREAESLTKVLSSLDEKTRATEEVSRLKRIIGSKSPS